MTPPPEKPNLGSLRAALNLALFFFLLALVSYLSLNFLLALASKLS
jgi:hypothetical protein